MTDPFEILGHGDEPVTPRAAFAAQLKRRLTDRLAPPVDPEVGYLFYVTLPAPDADRAARFYRTLFGWQLEGGEHGYHVEGVYPPMGLASDERPGAQVWIEVVDMDAAIERVRRSGGRAEAPAQYSSGLNSACVDDQGVEFNLIVPNPDYRQGPARSTEPGELFYWSLPAPDPERSKAFYRRVFGWEFGRPGDAGGLHIANSQPDGGLGGGRSGTHPDLFFRVLDLDAAMATVADLGGDAEPAGEGPEGRHALCHDDQGTPFGLSEPADPSRSDG